MTVYRILPIGVRRRLPDGSPRALGENGPAFTYVSGGTGIGVSANGAAIPSIPIVGQTIVSFSINGSLTQAGTFGVANLSIFTYGSITTAVNAKAFSQIGFNLLGNLVGSVSLVGNSYVNLSVNGRLVNSKALLAFASLAIETIGELSIASIMRGAASVGFRVSGLLTAKAGRKFRELWRNAYDARQTVLNAIDENNRNLAKDAGVLAGATATALVQTNTKVEEVDGKVTAEAQRVTVLTSRVGNVEGTQTAQGLAITNLQTTQTSQGNTLTSQSQQITGLQSTVTTLDGKVVANANATTALETRVQVNEQGIAQAKATWGVYLDVNGYISGIQSINNGIRSEFSVMADVFRLLSPAGADGMEIQNGYIRIWKGNSQTIIGNRFGVAGQGLMKWFGPNIGAAACTKANATSWEDDQGNAYFGGQVLQGVLRFFNSNTIVSNSATVETGMNASNGKLVAVQARFSYDAIQTYPNEASHITLGGGRTSAVIAIDRQYQGGGWVELTTRTLIGNADVVNVNDGPSTIQWSIDGSVLYTDSASTVSRNYRTRVVSISMQEYTVTNPGPTPQLVRNQYQSIEAME